MAEPLQTITAILPCSKWSCLLLRIVLQVAWLDDIKACLGWRDKELSDVAEKCYKTLRREVKEKGVKLSITEGGNEGEGKAIASCRYLEEKFQVCRKREGVGLAYSVATFGVV